MIAIEADRLRSRHAASPELDASSGGDDVDDTAKRLTNIDGVVIELRTKLDAILPHLATKQDLATLHLATKEEFGTLKAELAILPHLATKEELGGLKAELAPLPHLATKAEVAALPHLATRAELEALRSDMITWVVGTLITGIAAASAVTHVIIRMSQH